MKKIIISLLISLCNLLPSLCQNAPSALKQSWERDAQGNSEYIYTNNDYCDYHVVWTNNHTADIHPGKNTMMRFTKGKSAFYRTTFPEGHRMYKGRFISDFNTNIIYSLPVKNNDSTEYKISSKENEITYLFKVKAEDTIYATRGGIVCLDNARDMSVKFREPSKKKSILVYHKDGTFAQYKNFSETFVNPGEHINVGQAIGKARKQIKEDRPYKKLSISFFYLDQNKVENSNSGNKHSHFKPKFHTANKGNLKIEEKTIYIAQLTDSIITQDMSKRKRKKYFKHKLKKANK